MKTTLFVPCIFCTAWPFQIAHSVLFGLYIQLRLHGNKFVPTIRNIHNSIGRSEDEKSNNSSRLAPLSSICFILFCCCWFFFYKILTNAKYLLDFTKSLMCTFLKAIVTTNVKTCAFLSRKIGLYVEKIGKSQIAFWCVEQREMKQQSYAGMRKSFIPFGCCVVFFWCWFSCWPMR